MKKFLLGFLGVLAALCIVVGCIWGGEIATLRSIQTVEGNEYLYTVEYKAAYDLDDVMEKDIDSNSMLVTNHLLSDKYFTSEPDAAVGNPHSKSWWRYETAGSYLRDHNGTLTLEQAQECLSHVHWKDLVWENGMVEDTQYSNVFDQKRIVLYLRNWNDFDTTHRFGL